MNVYLNLTFCEYILWIIIIIMSILTIWFFTLFRYFSICLFYPVMWLTDYLLCVNSSVYFTMLCEWLTAYLLCVSSSVLCVRDSYRCTWRRGYFSSCKCPCSCDTIYTSYITTQAADKKHYYAYNISFI